KRKKCFQGPDYDESSDATLRAEHVASLLRRWELASVTWSSVDLDNSNDSSPTPTIKSSSTPTAAQSNRINSLQQHHHHHQRSAACTYLHHQQKTQVASAPPTANYSTNKERTGNRPETPVYVQRISSANRLDGLQDVVGHHHPYHHQYQQQQQQHCPSPNMPRHVLESISQSPTQGLKNPPGLQQMASPPTSTGRYPHHYHHSDQPLKTKSNNNPLNGESYGHAPPTYFQHQPQPTHRGREQYDSPVLLTNSPSNPYLGKFQISSSVSPLPAAQQYNIGSTGGAANTSNSRRRTGSDGYGAPQMT
ncbi:putative cyclin-dependent serine/threonine-protein kinase DDB_G0272797/DDB_G0274007, partial [Copidosoma floridanum]|uniref:putative cyclin-dependent serine/threonine-protein kinase DDB_G0272797/DDB_G0274007 n=1 Tax=Copidosoma floridanum TaxID=29053 RepID=UPI0006C9CB68